MNKLENLTIAQSEEAMEQAKNEGYQETQAIETVDAGNLSGSAVTVGKGANKSISVSVIPFTRIVNGEEKKLVFRAAMFNVKHLTTGKTYNNVGVKLDDKLTEIFSKPENLSKSALLESVPYVDSQKRQRTIVKFQSISK